MEAKDLKFEDIFIGQTEEFEILITEELVQKFAEFSGDYNPLHMDEDYAKSTRFEGRIVHGMAIASFFSRLIGMLLPGKQCLYLSQSFDFKNPARIGDQIIIRGEVKEKVTSFKMLTIKTAL